jgi:calcineurin-like phosphoesterase family protein
MFIISDTHFCQQKICEVLTQDKTSKLRPWTNADDMDAALIANWNSVVGKNDAVYHLGDVMFDVTKINLLNELNGRKTLILGNHDTFNAKEYLRYFNDVKGVDIFDKCILSHYPIHRDAITARGYKVNIHGHIHDAFVKYQYIKDSLYFNACVEMINYTPIHFDVIKSVI